MKDKFFTDRQFLDGLRDIENGCEKFSLNQLDISLGESAIKTYKNLGTIQSLLYRYACCFWGCKSQDHKLERIVGRAVSHCQASLRVLGFAYYDESLALTRNISEIANLFALFNYDTNSFTEWKSLDETTAWGKFSPGKVRKKIETLGGIVPITKEHYGRLCSIGTHINPLTTPQNYNPASKPTVGAFFQELGFIVALNELALSMSMIGGGVYSLGVLEESIKNELIDASQTLARESGSITTHNMNSVWEQIANSNEKKEL